MVNVQIDFYYVISARLYNNVHDRDKERNFGEDGKEEVTITNLE